MLIIHATKVRVPFSEMGRVREVFRSELQASSCASAVEYVDHVEAAREKLAVVVKTSARFLGMLLWMFSDLNNPFGPYFNVFGLAFGRISPE